MGGCYTDYGSSCSSYRTHVRQTEKDLSKLQASTAGRPDIRIHDFSRMETNAGSSPNLLKLRASSLWLISKEYNGIESEVMFDVGLSARQGAGC
jgi:hypothetical protein